MVASTEIERLARDMIARHGDRAARVAAETLNEMIDRDNVRGRDVWACVVHAIHELQGTGLAEAENGGETQPPNSVTRAPR